MTRYSKVTLDPIVAQLEDMGITKEQLASALDYQKPSYLDRAMALGTTRFHGIRKNRVRGLYSLLESGSPKAMIEGIIKAWTERPIAISREFHGRVTKAPDPEVPYRTWTPNGASGGTVRLTEPPTPDPIEDDEDLIPRAVPVQLSWSGHSPSITVIVSLDELAYIQSQGWYLNTPEGRQWMDDVDLFSRPRLPQTPKVVVYD